MQKDVSSTTEACEGCVFCISCGPSPCCLGICTAWGVLMKSRIWAESQPKDVSPWGLWLLSTDLLRAHPSSAVSMGGITAHHLHNNLLAAALTQEMVDWDHVLCQYGRDLNRLWLQPFFFFFEELSVNSVSYKDTSSPKMYSIHSRWNFLFASSTSINRIAPWPLFWTWGPGLVWLSSSCWTQSLSKTGGCIQTACQGWALGLLTPELYQFPNGNCLYESCLPQAKIVPWAILKIYHLSQWSSHPWDTPWHCLIS